MGATAAAESFKSGLAKKPRLMLMCEPSLRFRVPRTGLFIARYFYWTYPVVKYLIRFYLRNFMINLKEDYEMYEIAKREFDTGDPKKLVPTLICMTRYDLQDALKYVDIPVVIVGTSKDTFHNLNDARHISALLKNSVYVDLVDNKRSHSYEVCDLLIDHLKRVS
jgi:hypothetical protein